jgi:hypothetical protein
MQDFAGTLPVYDRKVQVTTSSAAGFSDSLRRAEVYKLVKDRLGQPIDAQDLITEIRRTHPSLAEYFRYAPAILSADIKALQNNPMLYKTISENQALVWREFGFAQTGFMNAGSYDGHELNSWMMMLKVSEEDAAFLKGKGYDIFRDAEGKPEILRVGRIDTDVFGYFLARRRDGGGYDYGALFKRYGGEDVRRVVDFVAMVQNRNPKEVAAEAYSHIPEGAGRWSREVGSNPEFSRNIRLLYAARDGMAVGVGMPMDPRSKAEIRQAAQEGRRPIAQYNDEPFNGQERSITTDIYGRTTLKSADLSATFDDFFSRGIPDGFKDVWKEIQMETSSALTQKEIELRVQGGAR